MIIEVMSKPGVYCIFFKCSPNKKYYGSTKNIKGRLSSHLSLLCNGIHYSKSLQIDFNLNGIKEICLSVIAYIDNYYKQVEKKLIIGDWCCYNLNIPMTTKSEQNKNLEKSKRILGLNKHCIRSKYSGVTWVWRSQT
jgi:hypothetical protein